jgi:hypothetical protein
VEFHPGALKCYDDLGVQPISMSDFMEQHRSE